MKVIIVFVFVCFAAVIADDKYTTKYDNIDIDEILSNKRLLKNYSNCLLDKGKCTADGTELKAVVPEALQNNCKKCSEKQQKNSRKVLIHLIEYEDEIYKQLEKKYDPKQDYRRKYCALAKQDGIKVSKCEN